MFEIPKGKRPASLAQLKLAKELLQNNGYSKDDDELIKEVQEKLHMDFSALTHTDIQVIITKFETGRKGTKDRQRLKFKRYF